MAIIIRDNAKAQVSCESEAGAVRRRRNLMAMTLPSDACERGPEWKGNSHTTKPKIGRPPFPGCGWLFFAYKGLTR
jgi:hypothetical protein